MSHPALVVHPLICPIICESSFITNIISLAILGSWEMFGLGDVIGNAGGESVGVLYLHKFLWLSKDLVPIKSLFLFSYSNSRILQKFKMVLMHSLC